MGDMIVGDIEIDLSGDSHLNANGGANNMILTVIGASNANLSNFPVLDANVNLSGASQTTVNLDVRLDANVSGTSVLKYTGEPTLGNIQTSGSSV